ncbi:MAG TPA: ABC transporter ATP-binding protein [Cellulomonas sp.]
MTGLAPVRAEASTVLSVAGLRVATGAGRTIVEDADLRLDRGRTLGLVGGSGSGKSTVAMAVAGLLPRGLHLTAGRLVLGGTDLGALAAGARRRLTADAVGLVSQHPLTALNPRLSVGAQLLAAAGRRPGESRRARLVRVVALLDSVEVPRAAERLASYPHELSGGLAQRVLLATALARDPQVLVADEPTTALDVSVQARVLDLIDRVQRERDLAVLLISHDIGVIGDRSDTLAVLDRGRVVEQGPTGRTLAAPSSEPLRRLLDARRAATARPERPSGGTEPAIDLRGVRCTFARPGAGARDRLVAVADLDLLVPAGGAVGIVGESGSGKTTAARVLVGLQTPDSGRVRVLGADPRAVRDARDDPWRRRVQYVFQDVHGTLDPRRTVAETLADAIDPLARRPRGRSRAEARAEVRARIEALLVEVGLDPEHAERYPSQLSGGQRQRVGIARALAPEPAVLVADEPVSALDRSVQAAVVDLLARIRLRRELTFVVVSHDFDVVRRLCDQVLLMRDGQVVERGSPEQVLDAPVHPYTRLLVEAVPGRGTAARPRPTP